MDRIREALGEPKISYWGQSYGTYLGAVYSSLYPEHTDRMILEGNIDPTEVWSGVLEGWGKSMAERFPDAAAVAAAQNDTLGLGGTADEVTRTYLALADQLDRERHRFRARSSPWTERCCAPSPTRCSSTTRTCRSSRRSGRPSRTSRPVSSPRPTARCSRRCSPRRHPPRCPR
ncbi:alpha/beta fold hydrolase [Oerskovia sp. M15]